MGLTLDWRAMRLMVLVFGLWFLSFTLVSADSTGSGDAPAIQAAPSADGPPSFFKGIFNHLETEFILAAGFRSDRLDWSIAGNNTNVLSELAWSDVDSYQLSLSNRSRYKRHLYLRGHLNYAWIQNGRVRDSDYGLDDRMGEYSRSVSDTNGDELWDVNVGGGYAFYFQEDRLMVAPMVGFSYSKQNFRITNGTQVISADNPNSGNPADNPPPVGPLSDLLNSTYFARWMGPWIGCDVRYRLKQWPFKALPGELGLAMEFHWADYYGEGNWNLRGDLAHPKSFEHETTGYGLRLAGDAVVQLSDRWALTVMAEYQTWTSDAGTDRIFSVDNGVFTTQLNEVNWDTVSIMLGALCRF